MWKSFIYTPYSKFTNKMTNEVERWWNQSIEDLETANILYKNKRYEAAAFYCQQSVEKALKALLMKRTGKMRRIHDLVELGSDINLPEEILDDLKELTMAYVYSRYPDVKQELDLKEKVSHFLDVSKKTLRWVEENL